MSPEHPVSPPPMKVPTRRQLLTIAAAAGVLAVAIAGGGAIARIAHAQRLDVTMQDEAVPTVSLATLDVGDASGDLSLPGSVQPFTKAAIYARVSGYLKAWREDIGANVRSGQLLATIDTPDLDQQLDQAKADLASAAANERLAQLTASRWRALLGSQAVAQQAADEKTGDAAAKTALQDAAAANVRRLQSLESFKRIVAPFDGVVTARNTDVGALINAGAGGGATAPPRFEISDQRRVRIYVQAPQSLAAQLQPGLKATFDVPQYPGRVFSATLITTSRAMGQGSASMLVELQADNTDGALQAGAYCQVHFQLPAGTHAIRIPATALAPTDRGAQVALVGPDGKAVFRTVQIGHDFGDSVEVTAGLSPTDRVIDNPPETLQRGDPVRLASAANRTAPTQKAGGVL
jgi:RND family efflux transporter MFP subunit